MDKSGERNQMPNTAKIEELQRAYDELPAPKEMLERLFNWLDEKLTGTECDNTLRLTVEFAESNDLDSERLCHWVKQYHGYCDCEILWNVRDTNPVFKS